MNPKPIRIKALSRDGWPQDSNPHEPGKTIVLSNGRIYRVSRFGSWVRA
jgi:hypothetical protein